MDVRVERPLRLDLGQAFLLERLPQRLLDQLHAVDERSLFVALGRLQCPLQVVEHGQQLPDEPLVRVRDQALLVARRPLAVVLEVRLRPLEEIEVLVSLGLGLRKAIVRSRQVRRIHPVARSTRDLSRRLLGRCLVRARRHEVFASSSSSMTS